MLTVALFSHSRYLCGAERMLLNLAILLERTGTVRPVLLVPGEGELVCEARRHGLACQIVPAPPWYLLPPGDMDDYRRGVTECSEALQETLVDLNSDAVLINTLTNVPAMLAAVALDIPSLLWVHGVIDSLLLPGRSSEFAAPHDELLLHSATRVIALRTSRAISARGSCSARSWTSIPNWTPVDPHFTAPPDKYRSRRFACLNTFDPHKGYATLLEAAALLKARRIFFELHLYGEGDVRSEMEDRAAAAGPAGLCPLPGPDNEVREVYDRSLGVVNPAHVEPFGMTLIEADGAEDAGRGHALGRAGRYRGRWPDAAILVDRGDAAAMADRMQALLESPELAQRLGERGLRRVCAHFNEEAARAAFLPVIEASGPRSWPCFPGSSRQR